jgi:hypothetical protein
VGGLQSSCRAAASSAAFPLERPAHDDHGVLPEVVGLNQAMLDVRRDLALLLGGQGQVFLGESEKDT